MKARFKATIILAKNLEAKERMGLTKYFKDYIKQCDLVKEHFLICGPDGLLYEDTISIDFTFKFKYEAEIFKKALIRDLVRLTNTESGFSNCITGWDITPVAAIVDKNKEEQK